MGVSVFTLKNGLNLALETKPFAQGGEGRLYRINSPESLKDYVAKIYHPAKRSNERARKIEYLINNPPSFNSTSAHQSIIWIKNIVNENGGFAGFIMPFADGITLEKLCLPKLPPQFIKDWKKYDTTTKEGISNRLKLCFNISVAINQIHNTGQYVVVDLKPENIKVRPSGLISILDFDSIEIKVNDQVLFPAQVITPEYAPPEYQLNSKNISQFKDETWDRFSLAIIFYKIIFGIHPFVGSCKPPYDKLHTTEDMIKNGLFPHNPRVAKHFTVIPPPHRNFTKVDIEIRDLFLRTFDNGISNPHIRPTADDWCSILSPTPMFSINRVLPSTLIAFREFKPTLFSNLTNQLPPLPELSPIKNFRKADSFQFLKKDNHLRKEFYISSSIILVIMIILFSFMNGKTKQSEVIIVNSSLFIVYLGYNYFKFRAGFMRDSILLIKQRVESELEKIQDESDKSSLKYQESLNRVNKIIQANSLSLANYNKRIQEALEKEKEYLTKINGEVKTHLTVSDKTVTNLVQEERVELKKKYEIISPKIVKVKGEIRSKYEVEVLNKKMVLENPILQLDNSINDLNIKESKDVESLEKAFGNKKQSLQKELKDTEFSIVNADSTLKSKFTDYDKEKNALLDWKTKALQNALEKYQNSILQSQSNLVLISNDAYSIFRDSYADPPVLVSNLARHGIRAASDIKSYEPSSGSIQRNDGTWVKVPQIAGFRAKCLYEWSLRAKKKIPSLPQVVPSSISSPIETEYNTKLAMIEKKYSIILQVNKSEYIKKLTETKQRLTKEIAKQTEDFLKAKNTVLDEINSQRNNYIKRKEQLILDLNKQMIRVEKDFRNTNINLIQTETTLEQEWENNKKEITSKYDLRNNAIASELKNKLLEFEKTYDKKLKESQEFIKIKTSQLKSELSKITNEYNRELLKHKIVIKEYEDVLSKKLFQENELNRFNKINLRNFFIHNIS